MTSSATATPDANLWQTINVTNIPKIEWLVPNTLPQKALICLYGAPNCGKTFLALHIALCLIMGRDCFPKETKPDTDNSAKAKANKPSIPPTPQHTVVYMLAEAPDSIGRRVAGWLEHFGYDRKKAQKIITKGLHVSSHKNRTTLNGLTPDSAFFNELEKRKIKPSLVMFDPLISALDGDENDSNKITSLVSGMDTIRQTLGCSVMVIHHPAKGHGLMTERGSSALRGGVDTHIAVHNDIDLSPPTEDQPAVHRIRLEIEKQREAPKAPRLYLAMEPIQGPLNIDSPDSISELGRVPCVSHRPTVDEQKAARRAQQQLGRKNTSQTTFTLPGERPLISNPAYDNALKACKITAKKSTNKDGWFIKAEAYDVYKKLMQKKGENPVSDSYFYKIMESVIENSSIVKHHENHPRRFVVVKKPSASKKAPQAGAETAPETETSASSSEATT